MTQNRHIEKDQLDHLADMCHTLLYSDGLRPRNPVIITERAAGDMKYLVEKSRELGTEYSAFVFGRYLNEILLIEKYIFPKKIEKKFACGLKEIQKIQDQIEIFPELFRNIDVVVGKNYNIPLPEFLGGVYNTALWDAIEDRNAGLFGFDHTHPHTGLPSYRDLDLVDKSISNIPHLKLLFIHKINETPNIFNAYYFNSEKLKHFCGKLKSAEEKYQKAVIENNLVPMHKTTDKAKIRNVLEEIILKSLE